MTDRTSNVETISSVWRRPEHGRYHRGEVIADSAVHIVGILIALAGGWLVLKHVASHAANQVPAFAVYIASLLAVLCVSLAYNIWPASPLKRGLARLDQALIFLFIAGSYTAFLVLLDASVAATAMLIGVWSLSLLGAALKLVVPGRFGRIAIILYLMIGWSGLLIFHELSATVPSMALSLLLTGGMSYSLGIVFHLWKRLRFQNALWHLAVVAGALFHLSAAYVSLPSSPL